MKTYTKQDFHNPEQLTRQQVGEEYRLLLSEEVDGRWAGNCSLMSSQREWVTGGGGIDDITYRVPLATPLPDGTVLSSNECCWSDLPYDADGYYWTVVEKDEKPRDPRKVVYCCGPMTGIENFNFDSFYKACAKLESQGYKAINPAAMDAENGYPLVRLQQLTSDEFQVFLKGAMKRDLDALQQCDAIALLPGWENSKGARAEKAVAEWLGLEVMYLDGAECSRDGAGVFGNLGSCSACIGYDGAEGESGPVDTLLEKAPQIFDAKQPYNSDERAEWDVSGLMSKLQSSIAPDDPKGAAGAKKPPMHLLPPNALIETAKAMGHGAAKYGAWNFIETTVCASTYVGALGRHWAAYARSEDIDPDSGLPHLALIAANCFVLLTAQQQGTLRDDRPKLK